jgi:hypothetical protein
MPPRRVPSAPDEDMRQKEVESESPSATYEREMLSRAQIGTDIATIMDRGTAVDVVGIEVAQQLEREGIVQPISRTNSNMIIQFGIRSARSVVPDYWTQYM